MLRSGLILLRATTRFRNADAIILAVGLASLLPAISGCGTDAFVPAPPPELNALPVVNTEKPTISIMLLYPGGKFEDRSTIALAARQDAGKARVSFNVEQVPTESANSGQAGMIRAAAARGATVLIVEPADEPEVAAALDDVRARGTHVLLLLKSVPSRDPTKPFKLLTFVSNAKPAQDLVNAVVKDANQNGQAGEGHVLIVSDKTMGPASDALTEAIRTTLTASGFKNIVEIKAESDFDRDRAKVQAKLEEDLKITMIFATDIPSLSATLPAVEQVRKGRPIAVGGCQSADAQFSSGMSAGSVGIIERNVPKLGRTALSLALRLARGESIPDVTEIPVAFQPYDPSNAPVRPISNALTPDPAFRPFEKK